MYSCQDVVPLLFILEHGSVGMLTLMLLGLVDFIRLMGDFIRLIQVACKMIVRLLLPRRYRIFFFLNQRILKIDAR